MRAHPCQPLTFLADICRRPASEKPFLRLVAGHPAVDAAVPTAALNKKPPGGIAAWIQGREGGLGRPGWVCFRNGCQSPLPTLSGPLLSRLAGYERIGRNAFDLWREWCFLTIAAAIQTGP